jgi:hypothetical protein
VQALRRAGEAQLFRDGDEVTQLSKLHPYTDPVFP